MSDERMPWLISKLVDSGCGRMAIIVGGGPSAPSDLKKIPHGGKALIISANGHAFKLGLKPEYIWCKDHLRIFPGYMERGRRREYMERELRRFGVPIVGPNYWCDYRAPDWPIAQFNSGQQALAFATLLGCAPIIPVGMDCFMGPTYFHDAEAPNVSKGRRPGYWDSRIRKLRAALGDRSAIRGVSGLVRDIFGPYRPDKHPPPGPLSPLLQRYVKMETVWVRARREFQDSKDKFAIIPANYVMPCNRAEADRLCKVGLAERVHLFDA
jgi:hypothetical protein